MMATTLYLIGILLRLGALALAISIAYRHRAWRFVIIAGGIAWISIQPIVQYFFSDSLWVAELQAPEVFLLTSAIALFVIYQFNIALEANKRYEQRETIDVEQAAHRDAALLELAKQRSPDLASALESIVRVASRELRVERVSVWSFEAPHSSIKPLILIDKQQLQSLPSPLGAKNYPGYFQALNSNSSIVATDAHQHPATRELVVEYLGTDSLAAMLDVPIHLDGEVVGIVCHDHVGERRDWTLEDQEFAHSIADLCALAIAAERRREISQRLESSERHLINAQAAGQFGSFSWQLDQNDVVWSGEIMRELGFSESVELTYDTFKSNMHKNDIATYEAALQQAMANRKPLRVRFRTKPQLGVKHYEVRANYRHDEIIGECFEGTVQNVTEQVLAEQEHQHLEAQLIQSQKMESIGTLAGGIAHDFNNILTPIIGYADIGLAETEPDSPLQDVFNEILHSSLRAKDLVGQILVFGRRWEEKLEPLDLADSITSALKLVRPTFPASIRIDVEITPGYRLVEADSTQMIQVLVNLCANAWHAMEPGGGTLSLKVYPEDDARLTVLEVSDTGSGIDQESIKRIFDPFYTTKDVGKGTGLGLAVVHGIVTKLGGEIKVSSEPLKFSTFKLLLPTTEKKSALTENQPQITTPVDSATILLVDDDKSVAGYMEAMLSEMGYNVDVYTDSQEALSCFQAGKHRYDALMTDLTMPNLSGIELTRKIREHSPRIPVLIISGHDQDQVSQEISDLEHCRIVTKPIMKDDLAKALKGELH